MKCEKCQQNEASLHLTQTRQGKTTEHHLCEACAREQGITLNIQNYLGGLGSLLGSGFLGGGNVFDNAGGIPAFGAAVSKDTACPTCGQSFDTFRRSGLFGCSRCYEAFADRLDPVMRRIQGSTRHVGRKVYQSADQQEQQLLQNRLSELKKSLLDSVQAEEYEKAARLRDEIHALENRLCRKEGGDQP